VRESITATTSSRWRSGATSPRRPFYSIDPTLNDVNWMVSDGQKLTAALDYSPLPDNVAAKVKDTIKQVK
jgi:hypothetical protein